MAMNTPVSVTPGACRKHGTMLYVGLLGLYCPQCSDERRARIKPEPVKQDAAEEWDL